MEIMAVWNCFFLHNRKHSNWSDTKYYKDDDLN